jgi:hypothetical protein
MDYTAYCNYFTIARGTQAESYHPYHEMRIAVTVHIISYHIISPFALRLYPIRPCLGSSLPDRTNLHIHKFQIFPLLLTHDVGGVLLFFPILYHVFKIESLYALDSTENRIELCTSMTTIVMMCTRLGIVLDFSSAR